MPHRTPITVARGDGIGPEIVDATLAVLEAAEARIDPEFIEVGEKVYLSGVSSGMDLKAWESLRRNKVFLKGPIGTPQGGGYKSLNVTTRKTLGLYANVRPCRAYAPFVRTKHPEMDVVIIRENEEDTYAGIEHQQTPQVAQCLKLISRPGCERIIRYAFEYARQHNRSKVTCMTKDNIMKLTDGMFHRVYDEIRTDYPDIEHEHWIIDIGTAKLADTPEDFDVVVTSNLYGDIVSDVTAQITGSVGLAGSANIGDECAMFEAIHGTAPTIAGQGIANPSGILLGAVMMLVHIHQPDVATKVHNAWLKTIEDGIHTGEIFREGTSSQKVGTADFADAVVARLGQEPSQMKPVRYAEAPRRTHSRRPVARPRPEKTLVGVDVFLDWTSGTPEDLGALLRPLAGEVMDLTLISNRGVKVWPSGFPETFCSDHWRCRFLGRDRAAGVTHPEVISLLGRIAEQQLDFIKTEHLYDFDGKAGFSAGQGE